MANDDYIYFRKKNVFYLTHDKNMHAGIYRNFHRLTKTFYIPRFSRINPLFIEHCFNCRLTQTKNHRPYGKLMPNNFPPQFFHTITIDFVFVLLGELNALLNVITKFIRKIPFIPKKSIYNFNQWVNALLN